MERATAPPGDFCTEGQTSLNGVVYDNASIKAVEGNMEPPATPPRAEAGNSRVRHQQLLPLWMSYPSYSLQG